MIKALTVHRGMRGPLLAIGLTIAAAAALATTTYTRDLPTAMSFSCDSGARFTIEFHPGHVRLRDGTGSFSLSRAPARRADAAVDAYTDGRLFLSIGSGRASLQHTDAPAASRCLADSQRS